MELCMAAGLRVSTHASVRRRLLREMRKEVIKQVSTHASVRRRQRARQVRIKPLQFQLTPP